MPRPYLHTVHSKPTKVSDSIWRQWYLEEHIRDMVYSKISRTGALYKSNTETFSYLNPSSSAIDQLDYVALYQTDKPSSSWDQKQYQENVRLKSQLWDNDLTCFDVADVARADFELVEILGSYEHNEDIAPHVIYAKISGEEVEGKLQFEHVNAASKLNGYRRSLLYRPVDRDNEGTIPYVTLIHEFDSRPEDLNPVKLEMEAIVPSKDCAFQLRSFELLNSEGFGGVCRKPERL